MSDLTPTAESEIKEAGTFTPYKTTIGSLEYMNVPGDIVDECDLCGAKNQSRYMVWDTNELPPDEWSAAMYSHLGNKATLCKECHADAMTSIFMLANEAKKETGAPKVTSAMNYANAWANKCSKHHFFKLSKPGYEGHLRLSSERGGKEIDTDVDYLLGFSTGWKDIAAPDNEFYSPRGTETSIPDFSDDDRSLWPDCAFIYWKDMGKPNPSVVKYAQWVAKEWKAGKSIQFGCYGGHGRTGTFAALVLVEAGYTGQQAFDWIRKNYCDDAIETKGQEDFVKKYVAGQDPSINTEW